MSIILLTHWSLFLVMHMKIGFYVSLCMQKKLRCMLRGLWHCNKGSKVDGKHDQAAWSSGLFSFVCDCISRSDMDIDYLVYLDESAYLLERVMFLSPTHPDLSVTEVISDPAWVELLSHQIGGTCRSKALNIAKSNLKIRKTITALNYTNYPLGSACNLFSRIKS